MGNRGGGGPHFWHLWGIPYPKAGPLPPLALLQGFPVALKGWRSCCPWRGAQGVWRCKYRDK